MSPISKHLKEPALYYALIVASMFIPTYTYGLGIKLYYPLIFFMAIYNNINVRKKNLISFFGWFIIACFLSIIGNDILPVFQAPQRFLGYTLLLLGITPILYSRHKFNTCFLFLQYTCNLLILVGFINFYLYKNGTLQIMEGNRVYAGTIGTNYLGMLCSIAIIYATSLLLYRKRLSQLLIYILGIILIALLLCLLLSSSRNSIMSILASIFMMIYIYNKRNFSSTFLMLFILFIIAFFSFPLWEGYIAGVLDKQGGNLNSLDIHSRESYWITRIQEFLSSPIYGIGFASISNPTPFSLKTGIVETTTGWGGLFSQLGLLGALAFIILTYKNFKYLITRKDGYYIHCFLGGLLTFFTINSIGEGYITTVGCQFTVYFWLTQGIIYCLQKKWIPAKIIKPLFLQNQKQIRKNIKNDSHLLSKLHQPTSNSIYSRVR